MREKVLGGSDREIDAAAPLGEQGLGIDSLGLVEFMVAVEKLYRIEIPETFWYTKDRVSLRDVAQVVTKLANGTRADATTAGEVASSVRNEDHIKLGVRVRRRLARIFRVIWRSEKFYILRYDLTRPISPLSPPLPYTCRRGTIEDLKIRWKRGDSIAEARRMRRYSLRLAEGQICLVAYDRDELVARDWLSATGDFEPTAPLRVRMLAGSCYGFDLNENPAYRGKSAGLALLRFSLEESRRLGFERQYTIVRDHNERMLLAARQLLGYELVGEARYRRFMRFAGVTWRVDGRASKGEIQL